MKFTDEQAEKILEEFKDLISRTKTPMLILLCTPDESIVTSSENLTAIERHRIACGTIVSISKNLLEDNELYS